MSESGCALLLVVVLFFGACGGGETPTNTTSSSSTPAGSPAPAASPLTVFEKDLKYVRDGGFTYLWVISRKDGKPLVPEDSAFLRTNAPQVVDWVVTDEGRKAIGGTNFNLEEGNLEILKKRFVAEDYSNK